MQSDTRTICAPVHQPGSAISIIRISGQEAISLVDSIFIARRRGRLTREKGFSLVFGDIKAGDRVIDEVLISLFRAPHSYTGEDMIEIACHGSFYIQTTIMRLLIDNGAAMAGAGEFTMRAFLNGKLDLSQAEAVADLIASESEAAHTLAMDQMRGGYSSQIGALRGELLTLVSLLELELDFGEEDVEFADRERLMAIAGRVKSYSDRLSDSFSLGNAVKRGIPVAIAGRPNVGKSTILNGLLNEERAIVSDIPGTTRDTIEDTFTIDGVLYRFIDTAGIRETDDVIENLGIQKTMERITSARIVLLVTEASGGADKIVAEIESFRKNLSEGKSSLLVAVNKTDLITEKELATLAGEIVRIYNGELVFMSANIHSYYEQLKSSIASLAGVGRLDQTDSIVTNMRHYEALGQVSEAIGRVLEGLSGKVSSDLIAMDTRQAIHYLGEITGEISTDEILGNIFKNFCIGK
jgi:tRNA modification GTPase